VVKKNIGRGEIELRAEGGTLRGAKRENLLGYRSIRCFKTLNSPAAIFFPRMRGEMVKR